MTAFKIISKDQLTVRHEGVPQYNGAYLGVDYLDFRSICSPNIINWEIGDYIDYHRTGKRYKLYSLPLPQKSARVGSYGGAIEYTNVQFFAETKDLEIAPFKDLVSNENGIHFSTRTNVTAYENVKGIARRIEACLNDIFPNKWRIEVFESNDADLNALMDETKEFSTGQGTCLEALSMIYDTWKGVGWIHQTDKANNQEVIIIGRPNVRDENNTTDCFTYGIGNGLTSIKKSSANPEEFATRLYVYGSTRNLPSRYYNKQEIADKDSVDIQNLMIPTKEWGLTDGLPDANKAYLEADASLIEKYGLIPRTVYFDGGENEEIYPSIEGLTMAEVRQAILDSGESTTYLPEDSNIRIDKFHSAYIDGDGSEEDYKDNPTMWLYLNSVGFDIAEQGKLTSEGVAKISVKSGMCAGREFLVKTLTGYQEGYNGIVWMSYEVERVWDESVAMAFPNSAFPIKKGDEFVLLDIPMPDYYIKLNENKLLEAGKKMLADYSRISTYYEPSINSIYMKKSGGVLTPGMYMQVKDEDIIDTETHTDYVLIDSLTIDESTELPTYRITLREEKRAARTFSALVDMIEDAKEDANQAIKRERQYTDRRFRSSQETLKMLESAFTNFSKGITPATVQTMAMLIGDESLQYKFTRSRGSLEDIPCPLSWSPDTRQMIGGSASLIHMTMGITSVVPVGSRRAFDYKSWDIGSWYGKDSFDSPFIEDADKGYYVYVRASYNTNEAWYFIDDTTHLMSGEDAYYFLVGVLNSEYDGKRDFVTLYGFTEVLPGQITTDIIRSASGRTYFDLVNGVISGDIKFIAKGGEEKDMADFADEQKTEFSKVDKNVQNLQDQIDGEVENHFYEGTPTTSNYPAVEWTSDIQKINHIGDTYTDISNIESDPNSGKSWRWCRCDDMTGITDYVLATDKDGVTYKLHWHPIADTDAVKALLRVYELEKKVDDAEYLKETFKKGSTEVAGAVVMSQMVAVRNNEEKIEAFLNGSDFAESEDGVKLILAGGIPATSKSGSVDLKDRAKEALTRIYENGTLETERLIANQGKIAGFNLKKDSFSVNIEEKNEETGAVVRTQSTEVSPHKISIIGTENYPYEEGYKSQVSLYPAVASYTAFSGIIRHELLNAKSDDFGFIKDCCALILSAKGALPINERGFGGNHAIYIESGMIAGLRPRTRVVTSLGTSSNRTNITSLDHTILFDITTDGAYAYVALPNDAEVGQEIEFLGLDKDLGFNITAGHPIYNMYGGTTTAVGSAATYAFGSSRRHIKFYFTGSQWVMVHWNFAG